MMDRLVNNHEWSKRASNVMFPAAQSYLNILPPNEYPRYFSKAKAAYVWDVDGNKYIDLFLGSGAIIIGHGNEKLLKVIRTQLDSGASVSMRHPVEVEVAEWFSKTLPFANRVAYFKTGSEAVHAALRIVYNITRKPFILSLGYHGWLPPFKNVFECNVKVIKMEWEKEDVEETFERLGKKIGAIILSPDPSAVSKEFYQWIESLTRNYGAYFIVDEIKSGFRMASPSFFYSIGLDPDICLFGKAVSNGFPLSIMVCKEEVVEKYSLDYFSTFAGEPLSLIAARETIRILENGEYRNYERYSNHLFKKLKVLLKDTKVRLIGLPTFFRLKYPSNEYALLFTRIFARKGILLHPYDDLLLSSVHDKAILEDVLRSVSATITELGGKK